MVVMSEPVRVLVSVDPGQPGAVARVASALQALGFQTAELLEELGTITGSCPEDKLDAIRNLAGVTGVERERGVAVPRPDSPIQ
jgi:hypothetical protein